jgi:hypothetical protein
MTVRGEAQVGIAIIPRIDGCRLFSVHIFSVKLNASVERRKGLDGGKEAED